MKTIDPQRQKQFFNKTKHQYAVDRIFHPPRHTRQEMAQILRRLPKLTRKEVVVDFGAGTGRVTIPLLQKGFRVLAVDISEGSLKKLRALACQLHLPGLTTVDRLPHNQEFDAIVGADILHHVDLDLVLPQLFISLKKGGKVIFSEPNGWHPAWYVFLPLVSWTIEKGVVNCRFFHLKRLLSRAGFRRIKISGLGLLPRPLFNWSERLCVFNDWLGNWPLLKFFSYRLLIEAVK